VLSGEATNINFIVFGFYFHLAWEVDGFHLLFGLGSGWVKVVDFLPQAQHQNHNI
jgi:hypothetical protein